MANSEKESNGNTNLFYIIILITAAFFGYLLYQYLTPDTDDNKPRYIKVSDLSQFPSVQMVNVGSLVTVPVQVKGSKGYFIIDTGAEESIFNSAFIDSLNIEYMDSLLLPDVNINMTDTVQINVDSLFVLTKTFYSYNLNNLTDELHKVDSTTIDRKIYGILGQDALNEYGLILNFQNHKVYITKNN